MTTRSYHKRRFYGGKEEPTPASSPRVSLYRELHPEMFAAIPSSKPSKQKKVVRNSASPERIREWLLTNGNATAIEIAAGLRVDPSTASAALVRGIDGVGVIEIRKAPGRKPVRVWGVINNG